MKNKKLILSISIAFGLLFASGCTPQENNTASTEVESTIAANESETTEKGTLETKPEQGTAPEGKQGGAHMQEELNLSDETIAANISTLEELYKNYTAESDEEAQNKIAMEALELFKGMQLESLTNEDTKTWLTGILENLGEQMGERPGEKPAGEAQPKPQ